MRSIVVRNTRNGMVRMAPVTPVVQTPRVPVVSARRNAFGGIDLKQIGGAR
ncbi:hypothetical protein ACFQ68_28270 [Amycolatopsis japonica]|uniref:hypothetical protein n=1 Tax=Amycolatopsis japonica TaxID=208439 RepID=UPI003671C3FA